MMMKRRRFVASGGVLVLAAACPALAQVSGGVRRVGYFTHRPPGVALEALRSALAERGWKDGENVRLQIQVAGEDPARWVDAASELVYARVDVLLALGTHMALAAKAATNSLPIVMMLSGYPVEAGLIGSYARPGGNVTGLRTYVDGIWGKYIDLLRETIPTLRELGVLTDYAPPAFPESEVQAAMRDFRRAAELFGVRLRIWEIRNEADFKRALGEMDAAPLQALFVTGGPIHGQPRNVSHLREFLHRRRLPMMNDIPGSVFHGADGLMAYAVGWKEIAGRTASFVDRILKGAKPADLPVEQPTTFELAINLRGNVPSHVERRGSDGSG